MKSKPGSNVASQRLTESSSRQSARRRSGWKTVMLYWKPSPTPSSDSVSVPLETRLLEPASAEVPWTWMLRLHRCQACRALVGPHASERNSSRWLENACVFGMHFDEQLIGSIRVTSASKHHHLTICFRSFPWSSCRFGDRMHDSSLGLLLERASSPLVSRSYSFLSKGRGI